MRDHALSVRGWVMVGMSALAFGCARANYVERATGVAGKTGGAAETCEHSFSPGPGCILMRWEKLPTTSEPGSFLLKIGRPNLADGTLLPETPEGALHVFLWMPRMNPPHGSLSVEITPLDRGTYRVSNVFFVMDGYWEIHVQLKTGDVVLREALVPYTF